jgi:serine protease Do
MERKNESFAHIVIIVFLVLVIIVGTAYIVLPRMKGRETYRQEDPADILERLEKEAAGRTAERVSEYLENSRKTLREDSSVADIAEKAGPSVVGIKMSLADAGQFLGLPLGELKAEGSGIIISEDGYILTNYHVVSFADPESLFSDRSLLEVFLPDGRETTAKFIGGYPRNDIAVIKVELDDLPVAEMGDSSSLRIGEKVVAIGNPLGMEFAGSVTVGYVSALNRTIVIGDTFLELIQTDAAINPGNSGGALVNSKGQVIGVNSVKIALEGVEGLGFAIPINDAWDIAKQIIAYGYVKDRATLGIRAAVISKTFARMFNTHQGIFVLETTAGGSAEAAGLQTGDIIVRIGDRKMETMGDIYKIEKDYKAGDTVEITFVRDGLYKTTELTFMPEKG